MSTNATRPRTGFVKLDNARRPRQAAPGLQVIRDPSITAPGMRNMFQQSTLRVHQQLYEIDAAYKVDSYIYQGVSKFVELCSKHGYALDSETDEPVAYLNHRFRLMGLMTRRPFAILLHDVLEDIVKFSNAFLVKKRGRPVMKDGTPIPGLPAKGAAGEALPVLGYFRADPKRIWPRWSKDGLTQMGWDYRLANGKIEHFDLNDIVHFSYNRQPGDTFGFPSLLTVIEDIREYRRCEEYVVRLLYKHLNPLIHHEVPDVTGTGFGTQEDVDNAASAHKRLAPEGLIVTPPGHKINVIGAESKAVRAEGYMGMLKNRVFAGIGVNGLAMGEGTSISTGSADAMTVPMHNHAVFVQIQLAEMITMFILYELLLEGGFNPLTPTDHVSFRWHSIETEARMAQESNFISQYQNGAITTAELRRELGRKAFTPEEEKDTFVYKVRIPTIIAAAVYGGDAGDDDDQHGSINNKLRPANQHGARTSPKSHPNK